MISSRSFIEKSHVLTRTSPKVFASTESIFHQILSSHIYRGASQQPMLFGFSVEIQSGARSLEYIIAGKLGPNGVFQIPLTTLVFVTR